MAKDANGDRLADLDLIDAYTRLGNIQGNGYEQNLGRPSEAIDSIGKAIALAQPLAAAYPKDQAVLRALAIADGTRGQILSLTGDNHGAVESLQASAATYDRLVTLPDASQAMFFEAGTATSMLGDELGQDTGLADIDAALASYRKALDLDTRALALDPNAMRVRRGIANMQMKIGNAEVDIDPAQALKDFETALGLVDALPPSEQNNVATLRLHAITMRKIAVAHAELAQYAEAAPLFAQAISIHQKLVDADPKDLRALADLKRALNDQATAYEYAADPALGATASDTRKNLPLAQHTLERLQATLESLLKLTPRDADRAADLASTQVRLSAVRQLLREPGETAQPRSALTALRTAAANDHTSPMVLDLVVTSELRAQPPSLRDAQFTLLCALRGVSLTHRKTPAWLLSLAQAYRAAGQPAKARYAAIEGLALLPAVTPGTPKPRIRKLLALEAGINSAAPVNTASRQTPPSE